MARLITAPLGNDWIAVSVSALISVNAVTNGTLGVGVGVGVAVAVGVGVGVKVAVGVGVGVEVGVGVAVGVGVGVAVGVTVGVGVLVAVGVAVGVPVGVPVGVGVDVVVAVGVGVGVGVAAVGATRTLSTSRSVLSVFSETSVNVSVVEVVLARNVKASGIHQEPLPWALIGITCDSNVPVLSLSVT